VGNRATTWVPIAKDAVEIAAIIVGGIWVYRNFSTEDIHGRHLEVNTNLAQSTVSDDISLIHIDVGLKNLGKVAVYSGRQDNDDAGLEVTVRDFGEPKLVNDSRVIDWQAPEAKHSDLLTEHNVLQKYPAFQSNEYRINPGMFYHERLVVPVPRGHLVGVYARFYGTIDKSATVSSSEADIAYAYIE